MKMLINNATNGMQTTQLNPIQLQFLVLCEMSEIAKIWEQKAVNQPTMEDLLNNRIFI
jgi:hypothetical protein